MILSFDFRTWIKISLGGRIFRQSLLDPNDFVRWLFTDLANWKGVLDWLCLGDLDANEDRTDCFLSDIVD